MEREQLHAVCLYTVFLFSNFITTSFKSLFNNSKHVKDKTLKVFI